MSSKVAPLTSQLKTLIVEFRKEWLEKKELERTEANSRRRRSSLSRPPLDTTSLLSSNAFAKELHAHLKSEDNQIKLEDVKRWLTNHVWIKDLDLDQPKLSSMRRQSKRKTKNEPRISTKARRSKVRQMPTLVPYFLEDTPGELSENAGRHAEAQSVRPIKHAKDENIEISNQDAQDDGIAIEQNGATSATDTPPMELSASDNENAEDSSESRSPAHLKILIDRIYEMGIENRNPCTKYPAMQSGVQEFKCKFLITALRTVSEDYGHGLPYMKEISQLLKQLQITYDQAMSKAVMPQDYWETRKQKEKVKQESCVVENTDDDLENDSFLSMNSEPCGASPQIVIRINYSESASADL